MELNEIEVLVGEAETRVERLRSLYDQYFMGIEKIEPQTARGDVERRIQALRRTQIRNTALRFRFMNVLLRYNTFAAHWQRICRQIEEGTYKHHLRKAKLRFDPHEAAREARAERKRQAKLEYGDTEPPGPPSFELDEEMDVDVDFEVDAPDMRAALRSAAVPTNVTAAAAARAPEASPAESKSKGPLRDASLDRPDRSTDPAPPPKPSLPPLKPAKAAPPALPGKGPPPVPGKRNSKAPPPPPLPNRPPGPSPLAAKPPPAPSAKPATPPARKSTPAPPPKPAAPAARKSTPAPKPAAKPAAAPAAASMARATAARDAVNAADERTRQTYSKYVETRKALGESTASITMDSFARSLRDSSEKLRQKHPGKTVDFDVQVKDGKTVLKPIVR